MIARLGFVLLALTLGLFALGEWGGFVFRIPVDSAVRAALIQGTNAQDLDRRVNLALDKGNISDAQTYIDLADFMGVALNPATLQRMQSELELGTTVLRNTLQFGEGFLTGAGESSAGLAGAVTSDFTIIGDVRDIGIEGSKYLAGQEYNQVILGLSVVGLAATAATIGTGGTAAVAKTAISLLKLAKRTGRMTAEFSAVLSRALEKAVDFPALKETLRTTKLTDFKAMETAMTGFSRSVKQSEIGPLLGKLSTLSDKLGPAETLRTLKFVKSAQSLDDVVDMTKRYGPKARGIMEITGKTSIRAFKFTYSVVETAASAIWQWGAWIAGILAMIFMGRIKLFRRRIRR